MDVPFLYGLKTHHYGQIMDDMHNTFRMGHEKYPKYITSAYDLEINWI